MNSQKTELFNIGSLTSFIMIIVSFIITVTYIIFVRIIQSKNLKASTFCCSANFQKSTYFLMVV